jgi:hypothetical protein
MAHSGTESREENVAERKLYVSVFGHLTGDSHARVEAVNDPIQSVDAILALIASLTYGKHLQRGTLV